MTARFFSRAMRLVSPIRSPEPAFIQPSSRDGWPASSLSDFLSGDHAAPDAYADELELLFASSIDRALARRRELLAHRLARATARPRRSEARLDRVSGILDEPVGTKTAIWKRLSMTCLKPEAARPATSGKDGLDFNPFEIMQPKAPSPVPRRSHKNGGRVKARRYSGLRVFTCQTTISLRRTCAHQSTCRCRRPPRSRSVSCQARMHRCACTRCLNLLLTYPEGCRANCAYCGLARHREADRDYADRNFIRVSTGRRCRWSRSPTSLRSRARAHPFTECAYR